jgi:hypothetical protein
LTLEQSQTEALLAANAGNWNALKRALEARAAAIAAMKPSAEELRSAIEAGMEIERAVRNARLELGYRSARLSQLQAGLMAGFGMPRESRINYRG